MHINPSWALQAQKTSRRHINPSIQANHGKHMNPTEDQAALGHVRRGDTLGGDRSVGCRSSTRQTTKTRDETPKRRKGSFQRNRGSRMERFLRPRGNTPRSRPVVKMHISQRVVETGGSWDHQHGTDGIIRRGSFGFSRLALSHVYLHVARSRGRLTRLVTKAKEEWLKPAAGLFSIVSFVPSRVSFPKYRYCQQCYL